MPRSSHNLQQYIFTFSYDDNGRINMGIKAPQKKEFASNLAKVRACDGLHGLLMAVVRLGFVVDNA